MNSKESQSILKLSSSLQEGLNLLHRTPTLEEREKLSDLLLKAFLSHIEAQPQLISHREICPIWIIITGLWSSKSKRLCRTQKKEDESVVLLLKSCMVSLLRFGVNPNIIQKHIHQSTAMHWLIAWDRSKEGLCFLKLIEKEGLQAWNPETLDACKRSPLSLLVARKYFGRREEDTLWDDALIQMMLEKGANPASKDCFKNTPLHYAFIKKDALSAQRLLEHSQNKEALLSMKNEKDETPRDLLELNFKEASERIRSVYEASTSEHILKKERFTQDSHALNQWLPKVHD